MLCECSDPDCEALFMISLADYQAARGDRRTYLTVPEHQIEDGRPWLSTADYWLQRRLA